MRAGDLYVEVKVPLFWRWAIEVRPTGKDTAQCRVRAWALPFVAAGTVRAWLAPAAFIWAAWFFCEPLRAEP